jgi:hypothetical protein
MTHRTTATRERLAALNHDFDRPRALIRHLDLTTLQLVWPEPGGDGTVFHVIGSRSEAVADTA